MQRVSLLALGAALAWAPASASAQDEASAIAPSGVQCLTKSPVTDFLCFAPDLGDAGDNADEPWVSFTSINQFAQLTGDFDQHDDVRDFTSEALFSASAIRLNRDLTETELRGIAREKPQWETFNRLSFGAPGLPILDLGFRSRELSDAQITNFFAPTAFNDVEVDEYSIGLRYGDLSPSQPYHAQLTYRRADRSGLIEFLADDEESVEEIEFDLALGSRTSSIDFTYVRQEIDQDTAVPIERGRDIFAARARHVFSRGSVFAGVAYDVETFGAVDVSKSDVYVGGVFTNLRRTSLGLLDLGLQGTWFQSEVDNDASQDNSQIRVNAFLRFRAENWNYALTFPFAYDAAVDGLDAYENYRLGAEISVRHRLPILSGATMLASLRLEHQEFVNIDDTADAVLARLAFAL